MQSKLACCSRLDKLGRTTVESDFAHASPLAQVVQGGTCQEKALRRQIDTPFDGPALIIVAPHIDEEPLRRRQIGEGLLMRDQRRRGARGAVG